MKTNLKVYFVLNNRFKALALKISDIQKKIRLTIGMANLKLKIRVVWVVLK